MAKASLSSVIPLISRRPELLSGFRLADLKVGQVMGLACPTQKVEQR